MAGFRAATVCTCPSAGRFELGHFARRSLANILACMFMFVGVRGQHSRVN